LELCDAKLRAAQVDQLGSISIGFSIGCYGFCYGFLMKHDKTTFWNDHLGKTWFFKVSSDFVEWRMSVRFGKETYCGSVKHVG